ncbi:MAG: hypothetical protein ACKO85_19550 [Isosphaeraceae bacterium]
MKIVAVGRPEVPAFTVSTRLRSQFIYFASAADAQGIPKLGENEFHFPLNETRTWHEEGVIYLVSPLDTANKTEVELTDEQEDLMAWLVQHEVEHVRVEGV